MKSWLRTYRDLIPPVLCVALVTSQILAAGTPSSQISHIQVNPTTTRFVQPVSQLSLASIEKMRHLANYLKPLSDLPEQNWLLDDSNAPELAIHQTDAKVGEATVAEGDAWTYLFLAVAVVSAIATVVAATVFAAQSNTPAAKVAIDTAKATVKLAGVAAAAAAAELLNEQAVAAAAAKAAAQAENKQEAANAAAEAAAEAANANVNGADQNAANAVANAAAATNDADQNAAQAQVNAQAAVIEQELQADTQSALLANIEAALATNLNAIQAIEQGVDAGFSYSPENLKRFHQKKKQMMLSLELDGHVLAGL